MCRFVITLFLVVSVAIACGGKDKGSTENLMPTDNQNPAAAEIDPTLCNVEGKRVVNFDLNHDDRPDLWKFYMTIEEGGTTLEIQTCKQVDFNRDNKVDYAVAYNRRGATVFEKFDFDFDGRFDAFYQFNDKSGEVFEVQRESGFDGRYDIQEVYDKDGKLETIRHDRNGDGKPDMWEQFKDGNLVAILYDEDFDNKVDRREEVPTAKVEQKVSSDGGDPQEPVGDGESDGGTDGSDGSD